MANAGITQKLIALGLMTEAEVQLVNNAANEAAKNALPAGYLEKMLEKYDIETTSERNIRKWWSSKLPKTDLNKLLKIAQASEQTGLEATLDKDNNDRDKILSLIAKLSKILQEMGVLDSKGLLSIQIECGYPQTETRKFLQFLRKLRLLAEQDPPGLKLRQASATENDSSLDEKASSYQEFVKQISPNKDYINEYGIPSGKTALYIAFEKRHFNKAWILLKEFKADPMAGDPKKPDINALSLARTIIDILPKDLRVILFGDPGLALRKAAFEGEDISLDKNSESYQQFVKLAQEAKGLINDSGESNKTALYYAIEKKHFNKALVLLKQFKADPKAGMDITDLAEKFVAEMPKELATRLLVHRLWQAIDKGDCKRVEKLITKVDVDFPDRESGRTALHQAYNLWGMQQGNGDNNLARERKKIAKLIANASTEPHKKDRLGFTPAELFSRPHRSNPNLIEKDADRIERLQRQTIYFAAANKKLKQYHLVIVLIVDVREIEVYLRENPRQDRIMFAVMRPNSYHNLKIPERHISPIYFERIGKEEFFIQIDSLANVFVIPAASDKNIKQTFISSPFRRQRQGEGCMEDLVAVAFKIADVSDFTKICLSHASKTNMLSLTKEEEKYLTSTQDAYNARKLTYTEEVNFSKVACKYLYQNQIKAQLTPFGLKPIANCYQFKQLPDCLLLNVEIYKAVGYFRQIQPSSFTPEILNLFFTRGHKRNKDASNDEIAKNIKNLHPENDFAGMGFLERHTKWEQCVNHYVELINGPLSEVLPEKIRSLVVEYTAADHPDFIPPNFRV